MRLQESCGYSYNYDWLFNDKINSGTVSHKKGNERVLAIIDYDAGNMKSVEKAFQALGVRPVITRDPETILTADHLVLPGVGAFGEAMRKLESYGLIPVIKEAVSKEIPLLGICLGLQILFSASEESPGVPGLSLLEGEILKIPPGQDLKIPHMGWNSLHFDHPGRLFDPEEEGMYVYFVHSYYLKAKDPRIVTASTEYGVTIHASVEKGNLFGCQFHPEKSSKGGLRILERFLSV